MTGAIGLLSIFGRALPVLAAAAVATWILSVWKRNVAIVDSLWAVMFVLAAGVYAVGVPAPGPRARVAITLVGIWGIRLAVHITWRNWGHGEDRRYRAIRARNEPHFAWKSLYLVFLLQALLAWIISLPLFGAIAAGNSADLGWLDGAGILVWLVGFVFETGGDWQLSRFKADARNAGQVLDRGFWRLTRHPNYFGDFCVWWGLYLIALAGGAWWSIPGPILMSVLLMRVSGVTLLEKDIGERRPQYADYVRRTNAFFPGLRRSTR
jgi:steroid 5-alpha reductase family enzyme